MKRIVLCIILAVLIFAGGTAALLYTNKVAYDITDSLNAVQSCYLNDDMEGAEAAAGKMEESWRKFRSLHMLMIDNDHTLEITMSAAKISNMLKRDNDEVLTECAIMKELIETYRQEQIPNIMNVL